MRPLPRLLALTDDAICRDDDFQIRAAAILSVGSAVAVVVQAPGASSDLRRRYLERVRALARPAEGAILIADDPTLGRIVGAHGVHLTEPVDDLAAVRATLGPGWVGLSIGAPSEATAAADYLVVEPYLGPDPFPAALAAGKPVFIGAPRGQVGALPTGAWGVTAGAALWAAPDPARSAADLVAALADRELGSSR